MSTIRTRGLEYLRKRGKELNSKFVSVSKYFTPEESWTKKATWWFDLKIQKIKENPEENYYLLCEKSLDEFYVLKVPNRFFIDNLEKFDSKQKGVIRLHLEAEGNSLFEDQRSADKVHFSQFVINP